MSGDIRYCLHYVRKESDGMKRLTALILAFAIIASVFTSGAHASYENYSAVSVQSEEISLENELVLRFRKTVRTLLNGFFMKANASFLVSATDISLDQEKIAVEVGRKAALKPNIDPMHARNKNVNWYSDNPVVAAVGADGKVSGRTVGTAVVYAVAEDGGFYDKCTVTVKPATNSAKYTVSYIDHKGSIISKVTYSTSVASVHTVNKSATIAAGEGEFLGWLCENNGNYYQHGEIIDIKDFYVYDDDGKMQSFEVTLRESVRYGISGNDPAVTLFGGDGNDIYRAVEPSGDGGYFACGTTTSTTGVFTDRYESDWMLPYAFVSKLDADGKTEWIRTYGSCSAGIYINDIAVLSDGNIIAVGYQSIDDTAVIETKGISEALIYKLSGDDGSIIREKTLGGKSSDVFNCVEKTTKGFAVGGKTGSTNGDFEGYSENSAILFHFDTDFNILWSKAMSGSKGGSIDGISADSSGNIFVSCTTNSTDGDFASFSGLMGGYIDTVIIKYNYLGTRLWYYVISSSGRDEFKKIQADGSGGCLVGGHYELIGITTPDGTLSDIHNCGGVDALLFSINTYGILSWSKVLSGMGNDYITDIAKGSKGYAVAGYTASSNREFSSIGNAGGYDGYVCYVNSSGTTLKMNSQAGSLEDTASCVACIGASYVVAGKTKSKDGSFSDYSGSGYTGYTAKYTAS